jgi:hypothetical protein
MAVHAGLADFSVNFTAYGTSVSVPFRVWAPDGVDRVHGFVFAVPGSGGDTRNVVVTSPWQTRLDPLKFAIVGTRSVWPGDRYWGITTDEIRGNMLAMIDGMAVALGRPEVRNAPMLPFGISQGGFAVMDIAQAIPDRTLGVFADKGGSAAFPEFGAAQQSVPAMIVAGQFDDTVPPELLYSQFLSWDGDARIAFVADWNVPHLAVRPDLRYAFVDELIKARYPHGQAPSLEPNQPLPLVDVPYNAGWLSQANEVEPDGTTIPHDWPPTTPASEYPLPGSSSWLPTEAMAMVYRAHVDRPVGIAANALSLTATLAANPVDPTELVINLNAAMSGVAYSQIDLYHGSQLIAEFDYSTASHTFPFTPSTDGNHTFVAIAEYIHLGHVRFTSKYVTAFYLGAATPAERGDFDGDGAVDGDDLAAWTADYGTSGPGLSDADGDGDADGADFLIWQRHVGASPLQTPTPEPTAAALLVAAAWPLRTRRRATAFAPRMVHCFP